MTMTENKNIQNTQANLDLQGDSWVDREFLIQIGQLRKRLNSNILPQFPLSVNIKCMIYWRIIQTANILRKIKA